MCFLVCTFATMSDMLIEVWESSICDQNNVIWLVEGVGGRKLYGSIVREHGRKVASIEVLQSEWITHTCN